MWSGSYWKEASTAPQQTSKQLITCLKESTEVPLETEERQMLTLARPWLRQAPQRPLSLVLRGPGGSGEGLTGPDLTAQPQIR